MKRIYNDILLISSLLSIVGIVLIIMSFMMKSDNLVAKVYCNNEVVMTYDIDNKTYDIKNNELVKNNDGIFVIKNSSIELNIIFDNGVEVTYSNCPDKICIHQGRIMHSNQTITCLPNKVYITLVSGSGVDGTI